MGQSVSHVDEIGYFQYLASNRPELLRQPAVCYTTLLFKPRYRNAITAGGDVQSFMNDHYLTGQRDEDERWVTAQQQMQASIQSRLPANVALAGYNPLQFVGYLNNHPARFSDANGICFKSFSSSRMPPQT
jgi:hypothetical protein